MDNNFLKYINICISVFKHWIGVITNTYIYNIINVGILFVVIKIILRYVVPKITINLE